MTDQRRSRSWGSVLFRGALCAAVSGALFAACGDDSGEGGSSSTGSAGSTGSGAGPGGGCALDAETHTGEGTYYDADGTGNCSFPASPGDLMVAAMNDADYAASAACGACVRVTGPQGTVTVRIVDRCPECPEGDIDMSPQAFEQLSPLAAGRVPIRWQYVACGLDGPIVYHFKEGSSEYWTAVQIRNHRYPIARFEYLGADGAFHAVPREEFNYFIEASGMGRGPYTFRVTDVLGQTLRDTGIPLVENGEAPGASQFPPCAP